MNLDRFTRAAGFKISNQEYPQVADGHNGDTLYIDETPAGSNAVTFRYVAAGSPPYRGSWASAHGTYDPDRDVITGDIAVQPYVAGAPVLNGWFSIMLDRDRTQLRPKARIHVYVRVPSGGAPDEGSYTGQGN